MGQSRRARRPKLGPAADCQTLVTNEGTIKSDAALAGGITRLSRPMETVGSPSPITPFTKPARRKVRVATTSGKESTEGIAPGTMRRDWRSLPGFEKISVAPT